MTTSKSFTLQLITVFFSSVNIVYATGQYGSKILKYYIPVTIFHQMLMMNHHKHFMFYFVSLDTIWSNTFRMQLKAPMNHSGYQYYFIHGSWESWNSAQDHCGQLGGELMIINTRDHWLTLMDNFINYKYQPNPHFWMSHLFFTSLKTAKWVIYWLCSPIENRTN